MQLGSLKAHDTSTQMMEKHSNELKSRSTRTEFSLELENYSMWKRALDCENEGATFKGDTAII